MGKLILLIILGFAVWWMWRKLRSADEPVRSTPERAPESMVGCALCGVNQPKSECVERDGRFYCCDAHRRLAEDGGREER
ncbi:MAG: hypothetical protein H3C26_19110 [Rhodocyclaceae bacterium]|nr:hypothetical protein [Rhodocyclaceae bacterium]